MAVYSSAKTRRLEGFAHARGLDDFGVLADRTNACGVYFCSRLDGRVLARWISLGWSYREAQEAIEALADRGD